MALNLDSRGYDCAMIDSIAAVQARAGGSGLFTTTRWSVVLAAGQGDLPRAQMALEQL